MREEDWTREARRDEGLEAGQGLADWGLRGEAFPGSGRALVIETTGAVEDGLPAALARWGFSVRVCGDARTGLAGFFRELPDVIVSGELSPSFDGCELIRRVRELSDVPILVVGHDASGMGLDRAIALGADRVLSSSADVEEIALVAAELVPHLWRKRRGAPRLTANQVRRAARSALQAELARQLVDCRGNLAEMARRMGKDRSTIRYHLRRFGMLDEQRRSGRDEDGNDDANNDEPGHDPRI